jgi:hypothetical protein
MTLSVFYTYSMAPELKDEFDESQFETSKELILESQESDDPTLHINYYSWETELPYGKFVIDKVIKHKAKDAVVSQGDY